MTKLDILHGYARRGMRLLPSHPGTKRGMWPYTSATAKPHLIEAWHACWPDANWAALCGEASGIAVIDVDGREGEIHLARLEQLHGLLPDGPVAISGSGCGEHRYFRWPAGQQLRNGFLAPCLELRGDKLLVTLPPSMGARTQYRWDKSLDEIDLPELPAWVCEAMALKPMTPLRPISPIDGSLPAWVHERIDLVRSAHEGARNPTLNQHAFYLFTRIDRSQVEDLLVNAASEAKLGDREIAQTINSAAAAAARARGVA